jgi:hypothetical protein
MNEQDTLYTLAEGATATSNYTSIVYQLNGLRECSIHVKFSSAGLNGTLALQASNDPTAFTAPSTADWVEVVDSSQAVASGASHVWNITAAMYKFIRFTWVRVSGTGTLTAWLDVKYTQG